MRQVSGKCAVFRQKPRDGFFKILMPVRFKCFDILTMGVLPSDIFPDE